MGTERNDEGNNSWTNGHVEGEGGTKGHDGRTTRKLTWRFRKAKSSETTLRQSARPDSPPGQLSAVRCRCGHNCLLVDDRPTGLGSFSVLWLPLPSQTLGKPSAPVKTLGNPRRVPVTLKNPQLLSITLETPRFRHEAFEPSAPAHNLVKP